MTEWYRALLIVVGLACFAFAGASVEQAWITRPEQRAVELATLPCATNVQQVATGVVVDDQLVVTVAHPLFEVADAAVRDGFGNWHRPHIVALDLDDDIAVLSVPDLRATPIEIAPHRAVAEWRGLEVFLTGGATSGTVAGTIERRVALTIETVDDLERTDRRYGYQLALASEAGDSGAPILDADGRLVAIAFARSRGDDAVTWATAYGEIADVLAAVEAGPDEPLPPPCEAIAGTELTLRPGR